MARRHGDWVQRVLKRRASRRDALRSLGLLGVLPRFAACAPRPAAAAPLPRQQAAAPPNIVLILLDDLRFDDLSHMAAVRTLLADEGASFSQFFATSPACAPARASILTGKYPHNHGVLRGGGDVGGLAEFQDRGNEESTVAVWLQAAGYRTALVGKYLNGYGDAALAAHIPPGWGTWAGVTQEGYSRFKVNQGGELVSYRSGNQEQYSTDVFAALANAFVAESAAAGQPFFLHLSPRAPHGPAEPATRHRAAFADVAAPRPPSFDEGDVSDKPNWVRVLPEVGAAAAGELDAYHRARLQTLLAVDELVTSLVETLEQTGTLGNTYVVFTSDNGYHLGEHRIAREKGSAYEESIHLPLLVRGPGIATGETVTALATQADLAPTFADWAGATVSESVDGRSLAPLLSEAPAPDEWRHAVLVEQHANRPDRTEQQPAFQALRAAGVVYVESGTGERELYDLANDPHQLENRADMVDPAMLEPLAAQLAALRTCAGAVCRAAEDAPVPDATALFAGASSA